MIITTEESHIKKMLKMGGEFSRVFGDPKKSLLDLIEEKIVKHNIKVPTGKMADRTNFAMEFVLTASPGFFESCTEETFEQWKDDQIKFAKEKFKGRLVAIDYHNDESSPHFHLTIIPVVRVEQKKRQGKKQKARGEKPTYTKVNKLSQSTLYTPDSLEKLCTEYADFNAKYGLKRGEFRRKNRQLVKHVSLKEYRELISRELPALRKKLEELTLKYVALESSNHNLEIANKEVSELLSMKEVKAMHKVSDYIEPVLKMMKTFTDNALDGSVALDFDKVEAEYNKAPHLAQNVLQEPYQAISNLNNKIRR